jgi:4-diphosphocytidyl-2-C-methyl-D-erythritol kinase
MSLTAIHDVPAPAKLNLFLHVVGRRADGYHLLQSLFVLVDWCDTLHFERRGDGRLARHDLGAPLPDDDLCLRAARLLQQAGGVTHGADISIDKVLPAGAGMGGGSSDAASTLLALNRLWRLDWPLARLAPLGLALGADVPFFLGGGPAFVEGIGERLTPVVLPPATFAVVKPAAAIETRSVFASPLLVRDTAPVIVESFRAADRLEACKPGQAVLQLDERILGFGRNDLQLAAQAACGEVGAALRWLAQRFGGSRMTGSGSAVYALLDAAAQAAGWQDDLPAGWTGRRCASLARHPLVGWAREN